MGVAIPRRSARVVEAAPRASLLDRQLGRLHYLHGWWYGARDCLGFQAVRLRLPGHVSGVAPRTRDALIGLDRDVAGLLRQVHPHLWAEYLAASEGGGVRAARSTDLLHQHFRLEAVCAAPFGEERMVELAIEPRWAPGEILAAYVQEHMLVEFRRHVRIWRTP